MMSTVISDGVLALVTFACAIPLLIFGGKNPTRTFGAACFSFIGLTAAFGAARYAGANVELFHTSMAWTSKMIAVPLLGFVFVALVLDRKLIRPIWYGLGLVLGLIGWLLPPEFAVGPGAAGMGLTLVGAVLLKERDRTAAGVTAAGVAVYIAAGMVIGTKGDWGGIPRVDLFHYALALAHPALAFGMHRACIR